MAPGYSRSHYLGPNVMPKPVLFQVRIVLAQVVQLIPRENKDSFILIVTIVNTMFRMASVAMVLGRSLQISQSQHKTVRWFVLYKHTHPPSFPNCGAFRVPMKIEIENNLPTPVDITLAKQNITKWCTGVSLNELHIADLLNSSSRTMICLPCIKNVKRGHDEKIQLRFNITNWLN